MIYTLTQDGFQARVDSRGAQLISLTDPNGTEYIWQRKAPYWEECAPVLFPVVGRCRDGIITVDGNDYPMAEIHGFALGMEFELTEQTERSLCFCLTDSPVTHEKYPYSFALGVKHTLTEGGLKTEFFVQNSGHTDIQFGIGGHPGISCPLTDGETFEDYVLDFGAPFTLDSICVSPEGEIQPQEKKRILTQERTLALNRSLFAADALIFENPPFDSLMLKSKKSGRGIRFSFENFTTFAMWTEAPHIQASFLCLEPWNGMGRRSGEGTELSQKAGVVTLPVGEVFCCGYQIQPILFD